MEQALESEFMATLHDEEDEPRAMAALALDVRLDPPASGPSNQLTILVSKPETLNHKPLCLYRVCGVRQS